MEPTIHSYKANSLFLTAELFRPTGLLLISLDVPRITLPRYVWAHQSEYQLAFGSGPVEPVVLKSWWPGGIFGALRGGSGGVLPAENFKN